jgi:hypothetical protein
LGTAKRKEKKLEFGHRLTTYLASFQKNKPYSLKRREYRVITLLLSITLEISK